MACRSFSAKMAVGIFGLPSLVAQLRLHCMDQGCLQQGAGTRGVFLKISFSLLDALEKNVLGR